MIAQGSTAKSQALDEAVAADLLSLCERYARTGGFGEGLAALLFGAAAWPRAPHWLVISWVLSLWLAMLIYRIGWQFLPKVQASAQRRLRIAMWLGAVPSLVGAASVVLFPYLSDLGRTMVTLILAGLAASAVGSSAGYMPLFLTYAAPSMGALAVVWSITPFEGEDTWLARALVPLLIMFTLSLVSIARNNFRSFKHTIAKRIEEVHLNQQLRAALDQAETANAAKTRFLASASHDLRQPLHSLSLFFASLRLQISKPDNLVLLGHIDQSLSALQSQMNTLLDMSKLDAGMVKLNWQSFALAPLLTQLMAAYQPVAQQKGIALHMRCPAELLVNSDSEQLCRVLRNLLDNAIKYTSTGQVRLEAAEVDDLVKLVIEDTGCGISPEHHQAVFEEFFQVSNPERDRESGLGLGLPIVRRLASLLALELDLQSTLGRGTTITLAMPRGTPLASHHTRADSGLDMQASMPMCRVLVLDDEAAVRVGMQALLQRMGCEVLLAASIDEALAQAAHQTPDLVLADLRLRGQESGITAVRLLRQQHPSLPALIITGDTAPDRMREVEAAGLTVLHKPVAADALMSAIARSLDSDAHASPD